MQFDTGDSSEVSPFMSKRLTKNLGMIALVVIGILSAELTISFNHIHGVSSLSTLRSVGQLVPLVIALGQLICVLYLAVRGGQNSTVNEESENSESEDICVFIYL